MGNYKFRLSDMMPNAWFYKLKDMGSRSKTRNPNTTHSTKKKQPPSTTSKSKQPHFSQPRKSYYFTRDPIIQTTDKFYNSPTNSKFSDTQFRSDSPRKPSKNQQSKRKKPIIKSSSPKLLTSSVSAGCSCRATIDSVWTKSDSTPEYSVSVSASASPLDSSPEIAAESFDAMVSWSKSCSCSLNSNANDIIIDMGSKNFSRKFENFDGFETITEVELPPIITKPAKINDMIKDIKKKETQHRKNSAQFEETNALGSLSVKLVKEESTATLKEQRRNSPVKRFSANFQGMKLRVNSPKIASKKIQAHGRKSVSSSSSSSSRRSLSDSFAIVKSSCNPQRDFRDSMVEMIMENNIRASKDLEELLACYLSLNSDEYHDLIIKVFKQIWFDLTDIRMK